MIEKIRPQTVNVNRENPTGSLNTEFIPKEVIIPNVCAEETIPSAGLIENVNDNS